MVYVGVVVGGVLYLFNMIPIDDRVRKAVNVLALILVLLWAIRWLLGHV